MKRLLPGISFTPDVVENVAVQKLNGVQLLAQERWKSASVSQWFQHMKQVPGLVVDRNKIPV